MLTHVAVIGLRPAPRGQQVPQEQAWLEQVTCHLPKHPIWVGLLPLDQEVLSKGEVEDAEQLGVHSVIRSQLLTRQLSELAEEINQELTLCCVNDGERGSRKNATGATQHRANVLLCFLGTGL